MRAVNKSSGKRGKRSGVDHKPVKAEWRGVDLRKAIKDQLKAIGKTAYWLAHAQTSRHPENVHLYLRGKQDTTGESIQELLELVGLDVSEKI